MPFEIRWYVPNRVVLARFWGSTTPEESALVSPEIVRLFEESPFPKVHVFLDDGNMKGLPASLGQMREIASFLSHPKAGWIIGVAPVNAAVKFMGVFLMKVFSMKYKRFDTPVEAETFLAQLEPDIDFSTV